MVARVSKGPQTHQGHQVYCGLQSHQSHQGPPRATMSLSCPGVTVLSGAATGQSLSVPWEVAVPLHVLASLT